MSSYGYEPTPEDIADTRAKIRAHRLEIYAKLSELGPRFADRTFENYDVTRGDQKALDLALRIAANEEGAWLYGPCGFGKSHLAAAIVHAVNGEAGTSYGVFTSALSISDRLKKSYSKTGNLREGEIDIIARYVEAPVLVLDDLDKARFTEWVSERLYVLVNRRYEARLPMIITTNVSPADLGIAWKKGGIDSIIGAAILDRLRDMCATMLRVNAPESYRGPAPK